MGKIAENTVITFLDSILYSLFLVGWLFPDSLYYICQYTANILFIGLYLGLNG